MRAYLKQALLAVLLGLVFTETTSEQVSNELYNGLVIIVLISVIFIITRVRSK
jgi:hypothetical protein